MAKDKGKKRSGDEEEQPRVKRVRSERRSSHTTRDRAESRKARHERQVGRKQDRLLNRCVKLEALLIKHGSMCDYGSGSVGERHKRLWRAARRAGLVGKPFKNRKPVAKTAPLSEGESQPAGTAS